MDSVCIVIFLYFMAIIISYLLLNYQLYKRLDYYPILERSSKLIFMSLNCMTIIHLFVPYVFFQLTDDFDENNVIIGNLSALFHSFCICFSIVQTIRALRIQYIYTCKQKTPFLNKLFKNEKLVIIVLWIMTIMLLIFNKLLMMRDDACQDNIRNRVDIQLITSNFICSMIIVVSIYNIRHVEDAYNISQELSLIFFLQYLSEPVTVFRQTYSTPENFWTLFMIFGLTLQFKYFIITYVQVIKPLLKSQLHHPIQSQYQILSDVELFLSYSQNVKIFYNFLKYKNSQKDIDTLLEYLESKEVNQQSTNVYNTTLSQNIETHLYDLNRCYNQFKLTRSFKKLEKILKSQENCQEDLYEFGMTHFTIMTQSSK